MVVRYMTIESYAELKKSINTLIESERCDYLDIAYDVVYDVYCKVTCRKQDWSDVINAYKYKQERIEDTLAELAKYVKWVE